MFFYLTLYMQNVLGYSAIQTGAAYLPLCFAIGISAGISSQLLTRVGHAAGDRRRRARSAPAASTGCRGSQSTAPSSADLLPGMLVLSLGVGAVFVAVTTAANAGVPADKAGLAASLLNASQQLGGALGLAIFTAIATSRTQHLLAAHATPVHALTSGFQRALLVGTFFVLAAAVIGLRATNTRGEKQEPAVVHLESTTRAEAVPDRAAA